MPQWGVRASKQFLNPTCVDTPFICHKGRIESALGSPEALHEMEVASSSAILAGDGRISGGAAAFVARISGLAG